MRERPRQQIVPAWQAMLSDAGKLAASLVGAGTGNADVANRLPGHAEAMLTDARDVAEAMIDAGDQLARRVPGYAQAAEQLRKVQVSLLNELKQRLDDAAEAARADERRRASGGERNGEHDAGDARSSVLQELLQASLRADTNRSRENLHLRILRSMVPDEARILAALADGSRFPLMHIETRGPGATRTVLANASTVGRVAGVHLNSAVPVYVTHMRDLGLVEEGPQDDTLSDQYALLGSEDYARRAETEAQDSNRLGTKVIRRTLHISPLGAELWAACRPADTPPAHGSDEPASPTYRSAYAGPPRRSEGRPETKRERGSR
jgi:vacuolar-type H+-ATPase subunit H